MTKEQLQKYIDKGFDDKQFNKLFSIQYLLIRAAEYYNAEANEMAIESGLATLNHKKVLNQLNKQIKKVGDSIKPAISNENNNVLNFMEDFDGLVKIIDEFMNC